MATHKDSAMNDEAMQPVRLDPLAFPLAGTRLIEASAGTGKTFTIAALYVRLVLGHGGAHAFTRPLSPPEILVVTFTDAATKELRDRIRTRLAEAAAYFAAGLPQPIEPEAELADEADGLNADDLLRALRHSYPPAEWAGCARRLQLAAEWMDESAVSTIHGWCNRMLSEHAFDSDSLFTQRLETDLSEMLAEAVRDYWRSFFHPLDAPGAAMVRGWWSGPDALQRELGNLLDHTAALGAGREPGIALAACREESARILCGIKAPWAAWIDEVQVLLDDACAKKQVNAAKVHARYYNPWLASLRKWVDEPELVMPFDEELKAWTRMTPEGLADAWKVGDPPGHPAFAALAGMRDELRKLPNARPDVLRHAAAWVARRMAGEQERRAQMGFQDLLTRLDAALHGRNGARLAELIRKQFPVALIDEFQDTDPLQYRIFDTVYRVADNAPDRALILIGDPKQAIYAFRGADIHTYLAARRATEGRHYTLATNYRATGAMVGAVNHVFGRAENAAAGSGAFMFRGEEGGNPVPFVHADARGRAESFVVDGEAVAALNLWLPDTDGEMSSAAYMRRMAQATAGEVVRLLQLSQAGAAGFDAPGQPREPLMPGDMAVLVNKGTEAKAVRDALTAAGVRSVYLSDRESVFQTAQAAELQFWLAACADPEDARLLRAALATQSLGLEWAELDALNHDEFAWEARVLQFRALRQCWRRQGVLPMLRKLIGEFAVARRLLARGDERALTDLLHLAELLQQASSTLDGEHALIRHLAEERQAALAGDDARRLRLESDAALLKVVTVHKAKGLEYPLVFLPYACAFRVTKPSDLPLKWHDDDGRLNVDLVASAEGVERADCERLAEDLRKFYVALTRARHAAWLGMAPLRDLASSAPGYLLAGGESIQPLELKAGLQAWWAGVPGIAVLPAPSAPATRFFSNTEDAPLAPERELRSTPREPWWIASYSALQIGSLDAIDTVGAVAGMTEPASSGEDAVEVGRTSVDTSRVTSGTAEEEIYAESREAVGEEPAPRTGVSAVVAASGSGSGSESESESESGSGSVPENANLHTFPRGAGPGSFLHGLLEWAAGEKFDRIAGNTALMHNQIGARANLRGWSHWTPMLVDWLSGYLDAPLPIEGAAPVRLASLVRYQVEMEFWFAIHSAATQKLDALVTAHTLGAAHRAPLLPNRLGGMLKGFIDLVFEHEGRFYVADYKSNWLGAGDAAYSAAAMQAAVLQHRYELQYVLYVFALHRLLGARLPDYDYDRHIGGALCLFIRGGSAETHGVHFERPPRVLIESLDALFSAPDEEGAA